MCLQHMPPLVVFFIVIYSLAPIAKFVKIFR